MKKVIVIGAGVAGKDVVREIKANSDLQMNVIGFVDDDASKIGLKVRGTSVLGTRRDLRRIIKKEKVNEVIIAIPSASGEAISRYIKICSDARVNFRIVPRVKEIIEGKAHVKTLRKPNVEDLLGRPVVKADVIELKNFFKGKRVFVTGAAGSIGSELSRQIAAYNPKKLILLDWWENGIFELEQEISKNYLKLNARFVIGNIRDLRKMESIFREEKPDYVFHAAAYKHVPLMEENLDEAVKNNVLGTLNVAELSVKYKAGKFVLVSTDKAAEPVNVMGATKLITEAIGKYYNGKNKTKFMAVRFGNVLDSYGSVVPTFRKQIEEGGPITITDKRMTRYFMTIPEAAQLILKAALMGEGGELFVLDMGEPIKILDLAENMIRLSGYIPYDDIDIVTVGKRAGEKVHETLFVTKEKFKATKHGKIFITKSIGIEAGKIKKSLKKLKELAKIGDKDRIRIELRKLVRTLPKNS